MQQWAAEARSETFATQHLCTQAARWGADQELDACCQYINRWFATPEYRCAELRNARRPKPNLKEQALALVSRRIGDGFLQMLTDADAEIIRQALEALPND